MSKPTQLFNEGDMVEIPDIPERYVDGIEEGKSHLFGAHTAHMAGTIAKIKSVSWLGFMGEWGYKINIDGFGWTYLESDLLIGSKVCRIDGQLSLFSL